MAIKRGASRFEHAGRGTGRIVSEGEPSAADVPDGQGSVALGSLDGPWKTREDGRSS